MKFTTFQDLEVFAQVSQFSNSILGLFPVSGISSKHRKLGRLGVVCNYTFFIFLYFQYPAPRKNTRLGNNAAENDSFWALAQL